MRVLVGGQYDPQRMIPDDRHYIIGIEASREINIWIELRGDDVAAPRGLAERAR